MKYNIIPPTLHFEQLDDKKLSYINIIANKSKKVKNINGILSTSFGFGGTNVALAVNKLS